MALQIEFTNTVDEKEVVYPEAYLKADKISIVKRPNDLITMDCYYHVFGSKKERLEDATPLKSEFVQGFYDGKGGNVFEQCYGFLKAEFSKAIDV